MTVPKGDYRSPERRDHFVYRAFATDGTLLYVGCTMNPHGRAAEHRGQSQWFKRAEAFRMSGPYNYDTARAMERAAIRSESPLWNCDEPKRVRVRAMHNRISKRWYRYYLDLGIEWTDAIEKGQRRATRLVPKGRRRAGVAVTPEDVRAAERADANDRTPAQRKRVMA